MDLIPDLIESVARLRFKVGGTFKGARREVDFTSSDSSVTITGTDDSVNEKMTLNLAVALTAGAAGGDLTGTYPNPTVASGKITQAKVATGLALTNIATAAPTPVAGQLWYDSDDDLLYVANSTPVWVCVTPQSAIVATSQTRASATYGDLATVGPAVTVTTGTKALVTCSCKASNATLGNYSFMGFAVSGATTVAVQDCVQDVSAYAGDEWIQSSTVYVTGLTAGANTFTAKYKAVNGTATFVNRTITVVGIP